MKKIFAATIACVLASAMTMTAFAIDITQDSDSKTAETIVSFNVNPGYLATIPATIELEEKETVTEDSTTVITYENDLTVSASDVRLKNREIIQVKLDSSFVMTSAEAAELPYTVTIGDVAVTETSNVVATFNTTATEQSSTLHFAADDPEFAGEYQDTVTFTISVTIPEQTPTIE